MKSSDSTSTLIVMMVDVVVMDELLGESGQRNIYMDCGEDDRLTESVMP